jgi:hypothetical protein
MRVCVAKAMFDGTKRCGLIVSLGRSEPKFKPST